MLYVQSTAIIGTPVQVTRMRPPLNESYKTNADRFKSSSVRTTDDRDGCEYAGVVVVVDVVLFRRREYHADRECHNR